MYFFNKNWEKGFMCVFMRDEGPKRENKKIKDQVLQINKC